MSKERQNAWNSGRLETRSFVRGSVTRPLPRLGPATRWNFREQRVGGPPVANLG